MDWCKLNNLDMNVSKAQETIVDFRRNQPTHTALHIDVAAVEIVQGLAHQQYACFPLSTGRTSNIIQRTIVCWVGVDYALHICLFEVIFILELIAF